MAQEAAGRGKVAVAEGQLQDAGGAGKGKGEAQLQTGATPPLLTSAPMRSSSRAKGMAPSTTSAPALSTNIMTRW